MTFVPSQNGTEMDVVLLNAGCTRQVSDGGAVPHHTPVLVARAGNCTGQCPKRDTSVAQHLFSDKTTDVALDSLESAVGGGGAWLLSGSDLSISKTSENAPALPSLSIAGGRGTSNGSPLAIPTTASEREDFSWVANMNALCPTCTVNSDVVGSEPPGIVAARLRLRNGKLYTYSVARIGSDVTPVHFQRLDGQGTPSSYSQSVANWVAADIEVSGDDIEIVEDKFDGSTGRSMTLSPDSSGIVEVAVLNLPRFVPPSAPTTSTPGVGKHFELFYELAQTPPSNDARLVPVAGALSGAPAVPEVTWQSIHPSTLYSELLNRIRLDVDRSPYHTLLCPPATFP
jgi:hypothetical protein